MSHVLLGTYTAQSHIIEIRPPTADRPVGFSHIADIPVPRASWWTKHPRYTDIWYAALEADDRGGATLGVEGAVGVYRLGKDGACEKLGEVSAVDNPCHVAVVAEERGLAVANLKQFTGGSALLLPLNEDGTFADGPNNYIRFASIGERPAMCHQCRDMPELNECWVVDTGNCCVQRLAISQGESVKWDVRSNIATAAGEGPRQIWTSNDGKNLYTLNARSCTVTHHHDDKLVSAHNILPHPHKIDMNARVGPPFTTAAALSYHAPSRSLIATSRLIHGQPVDSLAFFKLDDRGRIYSEKVLRPRRGKEYRGVGLVGDLLLVAGQRDGWLSCFHWNEAEDEWVEVDFPDTARYQEVVDIQMM